LFFVPTPLRITSTDNPRVKAALRLRDSRDRRETGLLIAEGLREVERALAAGLRLIEWYACAELLDMEIPALLRRLPWNKAAGDAMGYDVSVAVLKKLAYRDDPEGLIAVFHQPLWSLADLPDAKDSLFLIAVGIEKPGNLGAMARTAAAAGAAALIAADGPIDPFNPNAIRASTGAVFSLPVVSATSDDLLKFLAARSIRLHAAMLIEGAKPYTAANYTDKCAIAIGAEDEGLPAAWADLAKETGGSAIVIPMQTAHVDSLNASVAAGILMFEAARQRK
jgi:TrmH family RNA methyltransferase